MLQPASATTATELPGGYGEFLLTSLLVLVVVCVLAWAVLKFGLRKLYPPARIGRGSGPIQVLARVNLEPKQTLYVVEVGGKTLLLGVGDGGMSTLGELDASEIQASLGDAASPVSFADILRRLRGGAGREEVG